MIHPLNDAGAKTLPLAKTTQKKRTHNHTATAAAAPAHRAIATALHHEGTAKTTAYARFTQQRLLFLCGNYTRYQNECTHCEKSPSHNRVFLI